MREQEQFMFWGTMLVILIAILCAVELNPIHKKNVEKLNKPKPTDGQKITTNDLSGNVESIHPWGRTEVVPMKSIKLEYFEYCGQWVMYGDVVQPIGRKDYFMPVMKGHLDLNVREMTQTWIEYGAYGKGFDENAKTWEDFRVAHIQINKGQVTNIRYKHYRLDENKSWSIIAVWEAKFSESGQNELKKN